MLENVFSVNNKELQVDSKERSIGRVGMNNLWFVNHKSIFCSHKLKICKISIFHKSFFLKYDYFKIASTGDLCLSVCLDLDRQISCKNKRKWNVAFSLLAQPSFSWLTKCVMFLTQNCDSITYRTTIL